MSTTTTYDETFATEFANGDSEEQRSLGPGFSGSVKEAMKDGSPIWVECEVKRSGFVWPARITRAAWNDPVWKGEDIFVPAIHQQRDKLFAILDRYSKVIALRRSDSN